MRKFNFIFCALLVFASAASAQLCSGVKGPNLLGAKGTFSPPFITVNEKAAACLHDGKNSFSPKDNIGNKINTCDASIGDIIPCSDYTYTSENKGMNPEFTYSFMKVIGDENGYSCIHDPIWKAKDHTGDGGYFMAVNGAPDVTYNKVFYQIKRIPVCVGTTYEFSAWVINMMPKGADGTAPNVSFVVNGKVIGTSGPIAYDNEWHQVGGTFTASTPYVDLQVINATTVAGGNDLGLDDISIRVCQSHIDVNGPQFAEVGTVVTPKFKVYDPLRQNKVYKFQFSPDGGQTWVDNSEVFTAAFGNDDSYIVEHPLFGGEKVSEELNGYYFRLIVSTSVEGLDDPECIYFNDYMLIVKPAKPLPVSFTSFTGDYDKGTANLQWTTAQESNSDRFDVERSLDGSNFTFVASQKAAGNSSTTSKYTYADVVSPASEYLYYRLKQIDLDGKFAYSNILKLAVTGGVKGGLQIFPNPAVHAFTANFQSASAGKADLLIRNAAGQTVYSRKVDITRGQNSISVESATLSRGVYYVTIKGDNIDLKGTVQKQ